jgi:uracil-DNA glycosylase
MFPIVKSWYELLKDEFDSSNFKNLQKFLEEEYASYKIYPKPEKIFNALNLTKYEDVKVVIIGQDPYHQPGQAHGLCFSVENNIKLPPSLQNIYKEIENEFGKKSLTNGDLTIWAKQGVLLLNSVLTVRESLPNSHKNKGWENVTNKIVKLLNEREKPVVFMLWGRNAIEIEKYIDTKRHYVLSSAHPSPLSAHNGFFGCGHFKKANLILKQLGEKEIDW